MNLLLAFLILVGVTTMYHLLPIMGQPQSIPVIENRYHLPLSEAFKTKPNRARRCADDCVLREYN